MFETLTMGQSVMISAILLGILFAGITIRSLVVISAWTFLGIAAVGTLGFGMPIIYFWYMTIISAISVIISMAVFITFK